LGETPFYPSHHALSKDFVSMSDSLMRLAVMGHYPPGRLPSGGIETVMVNLVAALAQRPELELHVVQHRQVAPPGQFEMDGFVLHHLPAAQKRIFPNTLQTEKLARAWLQQVRPDAVISHHPSFALAAYALGIPAVHTIHGMPRKEFWTRQGVFARTASAMEVGLEWRMLQKATDIIAIADEIVTLYGKRTRARFHRVNNPISLRFFEPAPWKPTQQALLVGHLNNRKGIDIAIEAVAQVLPTFPDFVLNIIGSTSADPEYARRVQAQAAPLGNAIRFLGLTDQAGVRAAMERASIFLLTSRMENAPMVIAEAMATGRPVVSTRVGGVASMIQPGVTGYLAESEDVGAVAQALRRLLGDAAHAQALGARAARFAREHYHPQAVAQGYLQAVAVAAGHD
jgi:glycosyltransferase involved in cell wall biosynthesis